MQNFMPIGKAPAENSVTYIQKINSKLSIPPYTIYGRIKVQLCTEACVNKHMVSVCQCTGLLF